jgi:hypothetical protein
VLDKNKKATSSNTNARPVSSNSKPSEDASSDRINDLVVPEKSKKGFRNSAFSYTSFDEPPPKISTLADVDVKEQDDDAEPPSYPADDEALNAKFRNELNSNGKSMSDSQWDTIELNELKPTSQQTKPNEHALAKPYFSPGTLNRSFSSDSSNKEGEII